MKTLKLNSSSPGKIAEFRRFLGEDLEVTNKDLDEPDADPQTIVVYKASQFENVLVDDTSLFIEGADVGPVVRWKLDELPKYKGRNAQFVCFLAYRRANQVFVYRGLVPGQIIEPRGEGFGFNPVFQPEGSCFSLAEKMEERFNARYLAIQNLLRGVPYRIVEPLESWEGQFQRK